MARLTFHNVDDGAATELDLAISVETLKAFLMSGQLTFAGTRLAVNDPDKCLAAPLSGMTMEMWVQLEGAGDEPGATAADASATDDALLARLFRRMLDGSRPTFEGDDVVIHSRVLHVTCSEADAIRRAAGDAAA